MTARLVLDCKDVVGESIIWSPAEQCLYWVDIVGGRIHRLDPQTGTHETWTTPELPTSIGLGKDGGFIVGLRQRIVRWRPGGTFETFAVPEPDLGGNRLNEGVVAPDGSFWVGTMQDNIGPDLGPMEMTAPTGSLYRVAPDGAVSRLTDDRFGITNTMVWLDDGRFVTADTLATALYLYEYDSTAMQLQRRQLLPRSSVGFPTARRGTPRATSTTRASRAAPRWRGSRQSNGVVELIDLPCSSPTSCAFGGPDLSTLYHLGTFWHERRIPREQQRDGGLYALDPGTVGTMTNPFG